jgi:hypothetical protein
MATAKKSRSAVMALALVLGIGMMMGCSTIGSGLQNLGKSIAAGPGKKATTAPAAPVSYETASQPAAPAPAIVAQATPAKAAQPVTTTVLGDFPTSKVKPLGTWETMHQDGFTGGFDGACKLLGLNAASCTTYKKMHSEGSCVLMEVPNGVVLNRLTFTKKNGMSESRQNVTVALKNPPTRKASVCNLGGDVMAIRFLGCGNHAMVTGWKKPLTTTVVTQPQPATTTTGGSCPVKSVQLNIWEAKAATVPGVSEMIEETRVSPTNGVSRSFGATFRSMHAAGNLARSTQVHEVRIFHHRGVNQPPTELFGGNVLNGGQQVPLPTDFKAGDVIRITFSDYTRIASPLPSGITAYEREFAFCTNTFHAIEAQK